MSKTVVTLCRTCEGADPDMPDQVRRALNEAGLDVTVQHVDCMSGCTRAPTLAVRQTGKTAYLFGEVGSDDLTDLVSFLRLYQAAPRGDLEDARLIGGLRFKAVARIPADLSQ